MFTQNLKFVFLVGFSILSSLIFAQPEAEFEADTLSGCGSLQVNFTDLSQPGSSPIVSWQWDLGGNMSSTQNPGRIFSMPGSYRICLTVTDADGNTDTECKDAYIVVHEFPEANFTASPLSGCQPLTVTFTDQSIFPDGGPDKWVWGLGGSAGVITDDGTFGPIESTYSLPDMYSINLTVIDEFGCSNTATEPDLIDVFPLPEVDVDAEVNFACNPPITVNFTNNSPTQNTIFTWDFGNGDPVYDGQTPPPVDYTSNGSFDITVTATDTTTGCVNVEVLEGFVSIGQGVLFELSSDTVCLGEEIFFRDLTTEPANSIEWDFGDGNTSSFPTASHSYAMEGCYTVTLTRELNNCTVSSSVEVCVFESPQASFTIDNPLGCNFPHEVNFTNQSTGALSYQWIFGDSGFLGYSNDANPMLEVEETGIFPIMLIAEGMGGCRDTMIDTIQTFELQANIPINNILGCSPITINLYENSSSLVPITDWLWTLNDTLMFTDPSPDIMLTDTGTYDVQLVVTNALGCVDTTESDGLVDIGTPPDVDFYADPLVSCAGNEIQFTNQSDPPGQVWVWDFGDNMISTEENPVHEYRDTGCFDIELNVFFNGCNSSLTRDAYVCIVPPVADFVPVFDCASPLDITFQNTSIGADSVFWDFGVPGSTSDTSSAYFPQYTFPNNGIFNVSLYAFNEQSGCVDTFEQEVLVDPFVPDVQADRLSGCVPLTINLTDVSMGVTNREWISTGGIISDDDGQNTMVTFTTPGMYVVSLIVTNDSGCRDSLDIDITANDLIPDFTVDPATSCIPFTVELTDNSSNLFGTNTSVDWVVSDSLFLTSGSPVSLFIDSAGSYAVTMYVEDDLGCRDSIRILNVIQAFGPLPAFEADTAACINDTIRFENESIGSGLSYQWDFGDGNTSADADPYHVYQSMGEYTVCLTITDANGCDTTFCRNNYINIGDPIAAFTFDSVSAQCPPLIVQFENQSQNAVDFTWDFGDNSGISQMPDPQHVYSVPGVYDVTLIASANVACHDTTQFQGLVILDGPTTDVTFGGDTSLCAPATIDFFASGTGSYNYEWDFADGTVAPGGQLVTEDSVTHTYANAGVYVPVVTFADSSGCERTVELSDTIYVSEMDVDFAATPTTLCGSGNVQFMPMITSTDPVVSYNWSFPGADTDTSTVQSPVIHYSNSGLYDVTLTVNNGICAETVQLTDFIEISDLPLADFSLSDTAICVPGTVTFTDQSTVTTGIIDTWNWSFGDGNNSIAQDPTHTFTSPSDSFVVELIVRTTAGCTDTTARIISAISSPTLINDGPVLFCRRDSLQLPNPLAGDPAQFNFQWNGPGINCPTCLTSAAITPTDTTYWFTAENNLGCTDSVGISALEDPNSVIQALVTRDTQICAGEQIQLLATGGTSVFSYQWDMSEPGLSCYADCSNPIAQPANDAVYSVTVDNGSCTGTDSVRIEVIEESFDFLPDELVLCEGEDAVITIDTGYNPVWLSGSQLSCDHCFNPTIRPVESEYYIAEVEGGAGCSVRDSIYVNVVSAETIDAGPDVSLCSGDTILLNARVDSGQITWSPVVGLSNPVVENPNVFPTADQTYYLEVDVNGCLLRDSVQVSVMDSTSIQGGNYRICQGDTIQVEIAGFADTWTWSPDTTISQPNIPDPFIFPATHTNYVVQGQLGSCPADTALVRVQVIPPPDIQAPAQLAFVPDVGIPLQIDVMPSGMYTYSWTPPDFLDCSDCPDPVATVTENMTYTVRVTDQRNGCQQHAEINLIKVDQCDAIPLGVPNVFSPNGDGINDEFALLGNLAVDILNFQVYDRWGNMLFSSKNKRAGWDGTKNGEKLNPGVYVYFIEVRCPVDGSIIQLKGDITLVR